MSVSLGWMSLVVTVQVPEAVAPDRGRTGRTRRRCGAAAEVLGSGSVSHRRSRPAPDEGPQHRHVLVDGLPPEVDRCSACCRPTLKDGGSPEVEKTRGPGEMPCEAKESSFGRRCGSVTRLA